MRGNKESVHLVGGAASSTGSMGFCSAGRVCVEGPGGGAGDEGKLDHRKEGSGNLRRLQLLQLQSSTRIVRLNHLNHYLGGGLLCMRGVEQGQG